MTTVLPTSSPEPSAGLGAAAARPGLTPMDDALAQILARVAPLTDCETRPTFDALGCVLAVEVRSLLDVPPADNTSMDGYALRAADVPQAGTVLPVQQRVPAGVVGAPLAPGSAARIFTGAQVPAGADAVVMQEDCRALAPAPGQNGLGEVQINAVPKSGQWVRRRGEDVREGSVVLAAGTRLTPAALGLAASVGAAALSVVRRPRVALFSTGDELVMPGEPLKPGAIYNSNRFTLRALLQSLGCEVTDLGIVPDRLDATRDALRRAAVDHDLILTSGGVSMGEEDHIRPAVQAEGQLTLWQLAMKPGKPLAFGAVRRGEGGSTGSAWFLGLPGNPVSSYVTFLLLVRPLLLRLQGVALADLAPKAYPLRADFDWPKADKRREFLRVRLNERGGLDLFANQSSGVLTSAHWGDGLVDNPGGQTIRAGDLVRYLPVRELL